MAQECRKQRDRIPCHHDRSPRRLAVSPPTYAGHARRPVAGTSAIIASYIASSRQATYASRSVEAVSGMLINIARFP